MKRMMKKTLCLLFACVFVLTAVVPAFAATGTYSWYSGDVLYTAGVTVNDSPYETYVLATSETKIHYEGKPTPIEASSTLTQTLSWSGSFPSDYSKYLKYALEDAGYSTSKTYTVPVGTTVTVLSKAKSGTYALSIEVGLHSGTWGVVGATTSRAVDTYAAQSGSMSGLPGNAYSFSYVKIG